MQREAAVRLNDEVEARLLTRYAVGIKLRSAGDLVREGAVIHLRAGLAGVAPAIVMDVVAGVALRAP
jgi:hypothetical protein